MLGEYYEEREWDRRGSPASKVEELAQRGVEKVGKVI
jgi:hypothetical protein